MWGLLIGSVWAVTASAATYRVQNTTRASARQLPRYPSLTEEAKLFTERISLWGYDLMGANRAPLNVHLSFQYHNDYALTRAEQTATMFETDWNRATLNLGHVTWKPIDRIRLRGGRQWIVGPVGMRDFDGAAVEMTPYEANLVTWTVTGYGGRDVHSTGDSYSTDLFDVPGVDPGRDSRDPGNDWLAGAKTAIGVEDHRVSLQYQRRWTSGLGRSVSFADDFGKTLPTRLGSERLGAAVQTRLVPGLQLLMDGTYNALVGRFDHLSGQATWRQPALNSTVFFRTSRVYPWFDSSSIFNIFRRAPHWKHSVDYTYEARSLASEFTLTGWAKRYLPADNPFDLSRSDDVTVGGGLEHVTRVRIGAYPLEWRTDTEASNSKTLESGRLHGRTDFEISNLGYDLSASIGVSGLYADPEYTDTARRAVTVTGGLHSPMIRVGATPIGRLEGQIAHTSSSHYAERMRMSVLFTFDRWINQQR